MRHPRTIQLMMDSLRYWVLDMHVDGFRFDLAAALARELHDVDRLSAFFDVIHQDPVISQVKLIAEPWDLGEGGYQVGNFPVGWAEWNGKYRDTIRRYWKGDDGPGRRSWPTASPARATSTRWAAGARTRRVNFVTAHDGFTLARPGLVRGQAQPGQRRGQSRRQRRQPLVELRRRGPDRRPQDRGPPRAADAQLPGHPLPVPGHPDAAGRRRDRPHPARQQQRLLPGQRAVVARVAAHRDRPAPHRLHAPPDPAQARATRCSTGARSSRAAASRARR